MTSSRIGAVLPFLATLGAMAAFQVGAAFAKRLFPAVGPEGAATLRLVLSALMLLAVARPWRTWPKHAPLLPLAGLGLSMAGVILLFYAALGRLPLGVAIALQFLGPLGVAIFGSRRPRDLLWAALGAAGVWALVGGRATSLPSDTVGIALALGAAVCWATYILCGRATGAAFGGSAAALSVSLAAVLALPVGVYRAGPALFSPEILPAGLLLALMSSAIPFSLELYAMPRLPARTFAVFTCLEPAFGVLCGLVLLGEKLTLVQVAGVLLVMSAAAGSAWSSARPKAREPEKGEDAPPT